jgi:hypothetical protein
MSSTVSIPAKRHCSLFHKGAETTPRKSNQVRNLEGEEAGEPLYKSDCSAFFTLRRVSRTISLKLTGRTS